MKNFIGVFDNVVDESYCKKVIEHFNNVQTIHRSDHEDVSALQKDNEIYFTETQTDSKTMNVNSSILRGFVGAISSCLIKYKKEYPILVDGVGKYDINNDIKIQKTLPGEGYHIWHCENSDVISSRRMIVASLYLNDCEEGGETEFLYQHERIKSKTGRMVLSPTSWTHPHRGNPPLKGVKYMINGWLEYIN